MEQERKRALAEALGVAALVTAAVTVASATLPDKYVATAVGFLFLGATWAMVWRHDDARVRAYGLAFGGLVIPGALDARTALRATVTAVAWSLLLCAIVFVPFFVGWRWWWHASGSFHFSPAPKGLANEAFGQLVLIALPEEAFYRGYLQSRLDMTFPPKLRILGAAVGPGLIVGSIVFALGHLATIRDPTRLAVFFPSLLFGWLRARTGGVGTGVLFHALCNIFSEILGRGFGVY